MAAGLPNITGEIRNGPSGNQPIFISKVATLLGAFTASNMQSLANSGGYLPGEGFYTLNFDSSKSNLTYGNSTTVQPPAIALIAQIKY